MNKICLNQLVTLTTEFKKIVPYLLGTEAFDLQESVLVILLLRLTADSRDRSLYARDDADPILAAPGVIPLLRMKQGRYKVRIHINRVQEILTFVSKYLS